MFLPPPPKPGSPGIGLKSESAHTILVTLSNAFQNCMSQSGSNKDHIAARFQGKGPDIGQALPGEPWTVVLPT